MALFPQRIFFQRIFAFGLCATMLLLISCETKDDVKKTAKPGPHATAPTIQKPTPTPTPAPTPAPRAQALEPQPEKPDPVLSTIADAEHAYETGVADYKAGHLDAAKQDFNHAVDILMQGPVGVKSDDRLQQEFDKITEEINQLEMAAFKQGDGFTEQQPEPAPIDEANQVTFPADPNMKAKAEAELKTIQSDLPLMINDYMAGYINYFSTRGRGTFEGPWEGSARDREVVLETC